MFPLDLIDANPNQPRKHFDTEGLRELAASIAKLGILQPIVVRPVGDRFTIVAGERRWRAAQMAGLTEIPVVEISPDMAEGDQFVRSVAENVNRRDMTVTEEAQAFQRLVDSGMTIEEVAEVLGKRPQDIRWRLDLLALDPKLEELANRSPDLAWFVAKLGIEDQWRVWREINNGMGTQDAVAFCEALAAPQDEMFAEFTLTAEEVKIRDQVASVCDRLDKAIGAIHDLMDGDDGRVAQILADRASILTDRLELAAKSVRTEAKAARRILGIVRARS